MGSTYLIGTAPDQVPTNADLGEMAFQSKDNVNFSDGRGGLRHLDVNAISAQLNISAVDVFVYDTSKDSDGGAWRKRCQHTSWYNETLNTATRGSRREFPAVAVIVATTSSITIYDGDNPDLPMWMVFEKGTNKYFDATTPAAVVAANGVLVVGGVAVMQIYFVSDTNWFIHSSNNQVNTASISGRNAGSWRVLGTSPVLVGSANDVAMTVLPNAPIDAATGLPIPTIAVATNGGLSVIKHDGTVASLSHSYGGSMRVGLYRDQVFITHNGMTSGQNLSAANIDSFTSVGYFSHGDNSFSGEKRYYGYGYYVNASTYPTPNLTQNFGTATASPLLIGTEFNIGGSTGGLIKIAESLPDTSKGMQCVISTRFNTGWMPGGSKGAWLSDTTQETVVGTELVTNGTFDSSLSGWTTTAGSASQSSGQASITGVSGDTSGIYQIVSGLQIGATYILSANLISSSGGNRYLGISSTGNPRDTAYNSIGNASWVVGTTGVVQWTATVSSVAVWIGTYNLQTIVVDNVSFKRADVDRSVNNKGLQVFGNITKTPVAAGADLVAYNNNGSSTSYLRIPLSTSIIDLSTDFSVSYWMRDLDSGGNYSGWSIAEDNNTGAAGYDRTVINVFTQRNNDAWGYRGKYITSPGDYAAPMNVWAHCVVMVKSGVVSFYVNGKVVQSTTGYGYNPSSPYSLYIHTWSYGNTFYRDSPVEFALFRLSQTAPSAEQIAKMYNDEKVLFQDSAKATLYGTSDAVTALAYDEDTNLLHVGTSSGRSVFNGLRRVDNTTDAVGACISAAGGMVAED